MVPLQMTSSTATILFVLFLATTSLADFKPKRYRIDLDELPEHRWDKVIQDHMEYIPMLAEEANKWVPHIFQPFIFKVTSEISHLFSHDYAQEIQGLARESGLPLGLVVAINVLYDITAFNRSHILYEGCTSLVAQDSEGRIWHGRNLDYLMQPILRNTTIIADFVKNGKVLYSGTTFAMFVGLLTGQRPNAFTVSLNERMSGSLSDNIAMAFYTHFKHPVAFVIRQALEEETTFLDAVKRLADEHIIPPAYIIVGGTKAGEGALITRDRMRAADVDYIGDDQDKWFFVETNWDHWEPDVDGRRKMATDSLRQLGQNNITMESILGVLSVHPIRNNLTIYSSVMSGRYPMALGKSTRIVVPL